MTERIEQLAERLRVRSERRLWCRRLACMRAGGTPAPQGQSPRIMHVRVIVAAEVADPPFVDERILSRLDAINAILILFDPDRATGRAAVQTPRCRRRYQTRCLYRKSLSQTAPTGQRSTTLPERLLCSGKPDTTSISSCGAAVGDHQLLLPLISAAKRTQRLHKTQRSTNKVTSPMLRRRLVKG